MWLDALLNYITAIGWSQDDARFHTLLAGATQLIGKEIARFHTIIWPAILWAIGEAAPELVFAHGWITVDGQKMSKSLGNAVDPFALARRFGVELDSLFSAARGAVRQRLLVLRGEDRAAPQQRPRQRSRQPPAAHALDAAPLSRRPRSAKHRR